MKHYALTLAAIGIVSHAAITGTVTKIQNGTFKVHNEAAYVQHDQYGHIIYEVVNGQKVPRYAAGKDRNFEIVTGPYLSAWECATKKDLSKCRSGVEF